MPISATGTSISSVPERGFTLLEIMITLVLIGIISGFAILAIPGGTEEERLATEAKRLATLIELNRQEAILLGEPRGVRFSERSYEFMAMSANGDWGPVSRSTLLQQYTLPAGLRLRLIVEGHPVIFDEASSQPQVLLLSSGEATDFSAIFSAEYTLSYSVSGDLAGVLNVSSVP
jgi:general secretion pathway protein H